MAAVYLQGVAYYLPQRQETAGHLQSYCKLHTAHCTLHTLHFTLHTLQHRTLHIAKLDEVALLITDPCDANSTLC